MKALIIPFFIAITLPAFSQQKPADLDKSSADLSYWPYNYPVAKMNGETKEPPVARIIYSRPQKAGRDIFGGIVTYDKIWRVGANEATEIEFFRNVKFNDIPVNKGRYTLYAICNENKWIIIINNEKDVWGLYYNEKKDVLRTEVPVQKADDVSEALTIYFDSANSKSANLNIVWDDVKVAVPVSYK